MLIETLSRSTSFPLSLSAAAPACHTLPAEVEQHVSTGRPWHLVAWHDEHSGLIGFCHKGKAVSVAYGEFLGLAVEIMHPAKGKGWVSLEAKAESHRPPVSLLESLRFSSPAVEWLLEHKAQLESLAGCQLTVNDRGFDY